MKNKSILFLLVVFILFVNNLSGKHFNANNLPDSLYIGQIVNIELNLENQKPNRIFIDRSKIQNEIEVFDIIELPDKAWHYLLRIAAFDTGRIEVNKISLYTMKTDPEKNTAIYDTLFINPFHLFVRSSLTPADTLLKDIFSPLGFNLKFIDYALPLIVIIIVCLLVFYVIKLIRKLKNKDIIDTIYVDNRPSWMKTLELLEKLKSKQLIENNKLLDFYFELSYILRYFIEDFFKIKALEMTTNEIKTCFYNTIQNETYSQEENKQDIDKLEISFKELLKILAEMDKVKYAKFISDSNEAERLMLWVENYILSYKNSSDENVSNNKKTNKKSIDVE